MAPGSARWSRRKKWAILFCFYTALALLLFSYKYLDFVTRHQPVDWRMPFLEELTGVYSAMLLLPAIMWAARRWTPGKTPIPWFLFAHLMVFAALAFVHTSLMAVSRNLLFPALGLGAYDYGDMRVRYWMEGSMEAVMYGIAVTLTWLFDRYEAARNLEVAQAELHSELAQAQLRNLQLQLQPHFLFNALNTISSVMYEDVAAADTMITRLSEFLRLTLHRADEQEVRLSGELELLDAWLSIMRARFEDQLQVETLVDPAVRPAFVPQLILQPLVENSIRYGADPSTNRIAIRIEASRVNGHLRLKVRDHGPGVQELCEGVGLSNTRSRLKRLYGRAHQFSIGNAAEGGLEVAIEVPWRQ